MFNNQVYRHLKDNYYTFFKNPLWNLVAIYVYEWYGYMHVWCKYFVYGLIAILKINYCNTWSSVVKEYCSYKCLINATQKKKRVKTVFDYYGCV